MKLPPTDFVKAIGTLQEIFVASGFMPFIAIGPYWASQGGKAVGGGRAS